MHEHAAKILVVFFQTVIKRFDVFLFQKTDDGLFELAAALAGDYFHQSDPLVHGLAYDAVKLAVNGAAFIKNAVQIELDLCHWKPTGVGGLSDDALTL